MKYMRTWYSHSKEGTASQRLKDKDSAYQGPSKGGTIRSVHTCARLQLAFTCMHTLKMAYTHNTQRDITHTHTHTHARMHARTLTFGCQNCACMECARLQCTQRPEKFDQYNQSETVTQHAVVLTRQSDKRRSVVHSHKPALAERHLYTHTWQARC